jgi:hypothetical protein
MATAEKISREAAAAHLCAFRLVDPEGSATVAGVCAAGECFAINLPSGRLVYVLELIGCALWVTAAGGRTRNAARLTLQYIEHQARKLGARLVKFQTVRPGLVRIAQGLGYQQNGFVLSKVIA